MSYVIKEKTTCTDILRSNINKMICNDEIFNHKS